MSRIRWTSAGLGPSLLDVLEQIQRCLGVDTLALHANQPHFLKVQGCVDVQALPARRCLDRRPVVLSEPSVRWSGLVRGVHRIDEDPLLVRRQAVHKPFILRNKILLRHRVRMLRQPLRPPPVEAETVHQLDRSRMRVLNPEGLSQPRPRRTVSASKNRTLAMYDAEWPLLRRRCALARRTFSPSALCFRSTAFNSVCWPALSFCLEWLRLFIRDGMNQTTNRVKQKCQKVMLLEY